MTGRNPWLVDAAVKCPHCNHQIDGAALFGEHTDEPGDPIGLESGLRGQCDVCGATIEVALTVINPPTGPQ